MKKHFARFLALLLICSTFSAAALPVSAAEVSPTVETRATVSFPFTMTVQKTYDHLSTVNSSGKSFTPSQLSSTGVTTYGKIVHTLSGGTCQVGLGFLDTTLGRVVGVDGLYATSLSSNVVFSRSKTVSTLASGTYYLFVTNNSSTSYYMHGTVSVDTY